MFVFALLLTCSAALARPHIPTNASSGLFFFASSPTHSNETLLLLGGDAPAMLSTTFLRLCVRGAPPANCTLLPNVQPMDGSVKATLPASLPLAVFSASPCAGPTSGAAVCGAEADALPVNAPTFYWAQGDVGPASVAQGGVLRLFGSALAFAAPASGGPLRCVLTADGAADPSAAASARLLPAAGGAPVPLRLTFASCHALSAVVPSGAPTGAYILQVDNGLPGCGWENASAAVVNVAAPAPWPTKVFNVSSGGGGVWAALAAAAANGGGVVFFPRGRYAFNENSTLNAIPPFTVLQGEGTDLVEFYWRDMSAPPRGKNGAVTCPVQGLRGSFAIANVTLATLQPR